ncbi:MAG: hypothetical protein H8E41_06800 [Desulfobulbaceae bacterium]|uniref:Peptidase M23 domain-containing protein n=1 Tax=Candidatus Desulfobia pelagia TaxID=2841692 RepID=A0A8J6NF86_9BACT|nr:hypothetical protein [Candidatus Desulfobia pelagia]
MKSISDIPPSAFTEVFLSLNRLSGEDGFAAWHFKKGMQFGETEKWWEDGGNRTHPHEGVDFCFYMTDQGIRKSLAPGIFVPPLYDGKVVSVFDDLIGRTILLQHGIFDENNLQLYSLYGHVDPLPHIAGGAEVKYSGKIAAIADRALKKRPMPSHLHISTIWLSEGFPVESFHWGMENNPDVFFSDPLHVLYQDNRWKLSL